MTLPRAQASAPGKVILFGEHSVVYGEPSISIALDRRVRVKVQSADGRTIINGEAVDESKHGYINAALKTLRIRSSLKIRTESDVPSGCGLGSSAALSVATCAALMLLRDEAPASLEQVARAAFETELLTQGAASPNDTTVSTAGGAVVIAPKPIGTALWRIEKGDRSWNAQRLPTPKLPLVVANSGARGKTVVQVAKVRKLVESDPAARARIQAMGAIALEAVDALRQADLPRVGRLMDENHAHLRELGVETPRLAELVAAARKMPGTLGAKLTGAGGGGSILVLSERPETARAAFEALKVPAFVVHANDRGVEAK